MHVKSSALEVKHSGKLSTDYYSTLITLLGYKLPLQLTTHTGPSSKTEYCSDSEADY